MSQNTRNAVEERQVKGFWLRTAATSAALAGLLVAYSYTGVPQSGTGSPDGNTEPGLALVAEDGPIRQTAADASAYAKQLGARVEIGALRSESREVYANPDGTATAEDHAEPVRVVRDGRWVKVDATLVKGDDGAVGPRAATLGMRLSGGGDDRLLTVERAGRRMNLTWPGKLPAPTLDGTRATYREVFSGVDLVIDVGVAGFSHVLVIKTPEAAQNPELAAVDFGLSTEGLTVQDAEGGGLKVVDTAGGGTVLEAATPTMWDSGVSTATAQAKALARQADPSPHPAVQAAPESARHAEFDVEIAAERLTLRPDRRMLTDPTTRFPVYVDPVYQATTNSGWAMVASGYPSQEYWKFKDDEGLGKCPTSSGTCAGVGTKRLYYAMPTPYTDKTLTILDATFKVTMTHTYNSTGYGVQLYRAGSAISSATNWDNKPALSVLQDTKSPTGKQSSCTSTNQNVSFNVKAALIEANKGAWKTTTFGMKAEDEGDSDAWKRFCGNAVLSVHYNHLPTQPKMSELSMSPGGACVYGASRPTVNTPPTLYMTLRDVDHNPSAGRTEQLKGEVQVAWTPTGSTTPVVRKYLTSKKASGSPFQITLPADIPQNIPIDWTVHASDDDGATWGPWSWEGDVPTVCQFVFDKTKPPAPDIDSSEYLPLDASETTAACAEDPDEHGSAGTYGTFTFDVPGTDAVKYEYGFNTDPSPTNVLTPTAAGGPVSIQWLPEGDGPRWVTVRAIDKANNPSAIAKCFFTVATRNATGEWTMDDASDSGSALDSRSDTPATAGSGVTFGVPGPGCQGTGEGCQVDRAARLSGDADGYLLSPRQELTDTSTGFAVTAWVRLSGDSKDAVAVSQDATGRAGFRLGFDAATKKWTFAMPTTDMRSLGEWSVSSTANAGVGSWTHLLATYDPVKANLQLFVNGVLQATAPRRSAFEAHGPVQIGRALMGLGGYGEFWPGDLANVAVFDRIVNPGEAVEMNKLLPLRQGYWPLNDSSGGRSPEYEGGQDLQLSNGATVVVLDDPFGEPALVGDGHLVLDGVDDSASTAAAVATNDGSFTVTVRVRVSSVPTRPMTVVSQSGTKQSGFAIRCVDDHWEVALPGSDAVGATVTRVIDDQVPVTPTSAGTHLAFVYNAFTNEARLFVNGQLAGSATVSYRATWRAGGGLQVGRQLADGAFGEYFSGVADDVRVYAGVASDPTIARLALLTEQPEL
jgi:hypothetical protein